MAIVEAASCGLQVVSTKVGGIPEVLPSSLIILTEPNVDAVLNGVLKAIEKVVLHKSMGKMDANRNGPLPCNGILPNVQLLNGKSGKGIKRQFLLEDKNSNSNRGSKKRKNNQSFNDEDIHKISHRVICPFECNDVVGRLYNWQNVTTRTEKVYRSVMTEADPKFGDKLNCYLKACTPFLLVVSFSFLLIKLLDYIQPRRYIDMARSFNDLNDENSTKEQSKNSKINVQNK